jgi:hypothetical protein
MKKRNIKIVRPAGWAVSLVALAGATAVAAKNWDEWSAPMNLELLPGSSPVLNTPAIDGCVSHSGDGLTIVFNSNRDGTHDLYMAQRSSKSVGFGAPVKLPPPINTDDFAESCATLGPGNRLYFSSTRDDDAGDIVVSKRGPKGWSVPQNLGPSINHAGWLEETPDFFEDEEGRQVMIFTRRNLSSTVGDIYQSIEGGPPTLVHGGPHSSATDARGSVTNDGLTMFWDSNRTGTLGGPDLYYATRSSTSEPFGSAIHLQQLSSAGFDARPFISKDGSFLTFSSNRPGSESPAPDMWFAAREKITGN